MKDNVFDFTPTPLPERRNQTPDTGLPTRPATEAERHRIYEEWRSSGTWRDYANEQALAELKRAHRANSQDKSLTAAKKENRHNELWQEYYAAEDYLETYDQYWARQEREWKILTRIGQEQGWSLPAGAGITAGLGQPGRWLIDNFVPAYGLSLIHGLSDSWKSLVLLEILFALTTGSKLFGKFTVLQRIPRVLLITAEDPFRRIEERLQGMANARHVPFPSGIMVKCVNYEVLDSKRSFDDLRIESEAEDYGYIAFDAFGTLTTRADRDPHRIKPVMNRIRRFLNDTGMGGALTAHDKTPDAHTLGTFPSGGRLGSRALTKLKRLPPAATLARISGGVSVTRYCDQVIGLHPTEPHRSVLVRPERSRQGGDLTPYMVYGTFAAPDGQGDYLRLLHEAVSDREAVEPLKARILRHLQHGPCSKNVLYKAIGGQKTVLLACLEELTTEEQTSITPMGNRHQVSLVGGSATPGATS